VPEEGLRYKCVGGLELVVSVLVCVGLLTGCLNDFTDDSVVCGNGRLDPGEACDDGNTVDGDTCRADCLQDLVLCGNGTLDLGETCDDGGTVPGDGCTADCQVETCGQSTCPWGCCDGQGICLPGTQDAVCGIGGEVCADCETTGAICRDQQCQVPGNCVPDETEACGDCGTRVCDVDLTWGACLHQGECAVDQVEYGDSCGLCGHEERVCDADCTWGDLSCVDESGECEADTVEVGAACGGCQHQQRTCTSLCLWDPWVCTADPPVTDCGLCVRCDGSGNCDNYYNAGVKDLVEPQTCDALHYRCDGNGDCTAPEVNVDHDYCLQATEAKSCDTYCADQGAISCVGKEIGCLQTNPVFYDVSCGSSQSGTQFCWDAHGDAYVYRITCICHEYLYD